MRRHHRVVGQRNQKVRPAAHQLDRPAVENRQRAFGRKIRVARLPWAGAGVPQPPLDEGVWRPPKVALPPRWQAQRVELVRPEQSFRKRVDADGRLAAVKIAAMRSAAAAVGTCASCEQRFDPGRRLGAAAAVEAHSHSVAPDVDRKVGFGHCDGGAKRQLVAVDTRYGAPSVQRRFGVAAAPPIVVATRA